MNRPLFALIFAAVLILAFVGMWLGWRARVRRDADVLGTAVAPAGALIAAFAKVQYVSTTPVGEPLVRVAAPGLRYRGPAEVSVHRDGVTVRVAGEQPVHLAAAQLRGGGTASRRVGKAVERDGLGLLRWVSDADGAESRELESSFRFENAEEQRRFAAALDEAAGAPSDPASRTV